MISLGWTKSKTMGGKRLVIVLLAVCLGQTSKPIDMLIIPAVATDIQHVTDLMGSFNKLKLSGDVVDLCLESDPVCFK